MIDAYAAGIIDGEGCITIAQHCKGQWFSIRIDVGMSDKSIALLDALKQTYGGSVRQTREATEKWEASSAWGIFGKEAAAFLVKIEQHLFLKVEQARLALRLQDILDTLPRNPNGSAHWTDETRQRGTAIRLRVQELNRKGPDTTQMPADGWFARLVAGRWVTPQQSMLADLGWGEFSETWPRAGTMLNGSVYRLLPLVPRISGTAFSYWPTPTVPNGGRVAKGIGPTGQTPGGKKRQVDLQHAVRMVEHQMWPTPRAADGERGGRGNKNNHYRFYPTPTASDATGGPAYSKPPARQGGFSLKEITPGALNPMWVEWLMGFPLGWTDLEDWEMR